MRYTSVVSVLAAVSAVSAFSYHGRVQQPIMNQVPNLGPAIPPPSKDNPSQPPADGDTVMLSDVLGRDRSINIFAGFTRDITPITQRLEDSTQHTTILAPVNSAITALPRKPWEDPEDYDNLGDQAYEGEKGEERARRNMRRFVDAHVVPVSPWKEGEKVKTLAGAEIWWEAKEGSKFVSAAFMFLLAIIVLTLACRYNQEILRS